MNPEGDLPFITLSGQTHSGAGPIMKFLCKTYVEAAEKFYPESMVESIDGWLNWYSIDFAPAFQKVVEPALKAISQQQSELSEEGKQQVENAMLIIFQNLNILD